MKPETKTQAASPRKFTTHEIHYIDALDQIDIKLRRARQIIAEFYDEIATSEDRYPTFDDADTVRSADAAKNNPLFKLILEYPRYVTLLEAACEYIGDAHNETVQALVNSGTRKNDSTFVVR